MWPQAAFYNQADGGLQTYGLSIWCDRTATAHIKSKSPFVQYTTYRHFNSLDKSGNYLLASHLYHGSLTRHYANRKKCSSL
jgi:hypothetical protein